MEFALSTIMRLMGVRLTCLGGHLCQRKHHERLVNVGDGGVSHCIAAVEHLLHHACSTTHEGLTSMPQTVH